ncbi:phosphoribosylaminoimidazolesuccinocarboxamide synthase [Enterococcus thailandicus]|uniref:Phosphoribosylaminoimidazole-succinocarboxamide synthase n=1 Tax=Enterococcus thailandicus TaxID=417368 RepID=A0A179EV80_ENTTH|nr:phosphoribosylaminoimidazolesuccinocarboxamide synthase [Enterococcus thailandicus]ASZ07834.1 phosphoribosylaminoimidazolesuccinocarboxamide synthase [Enterococcus thailandicus]MDT2750463.1 phosphoribosylaminoimidazolesuccinocarboxamide synthase [Enterococcus thailandicus]MDT2775024.1 phosphoribosylaminoimidazolesuccinocarboxamide synthase [Enterococcus thailandicus]MDT2793520.1 phosphoribosylaminoimidazolesuccinocarboxamide synthase [Enterococcus thailandicus]OAQ57126.1 phosphoribosylamino
MEKAELLYEGKAKKMFATEDKQVIWVEYLDQATALNGVMKDQIQGKGELNNQITSRIFQYLTKKGIDNHFIDILSKTEQLVKKVEVIPLEVVVRNFAAGSFSKRLAVPEGTLLPEPIIEFYYKDDLLDDPFINEAHIAFLELATPAEIQEIKLIALQVNEALQELFAGIDLQLIDFKLEFGRLADGKILLADEISPDTCRLWDSDSHEHMDKDVYRRKIGNLVPVYQEVLTRLNNYSF